MNISTVLAEVAELGIFHEAYDVPESKVTLEVCILVSEGNHWLQQYLCWAEDQSVFGVLNDEAIILGHAVVRK